MSTLPEPNANTVSSESHRNHDSDRDRGGAVLRPEVDDASFPFLTCICPTYKRPELLANSLALFLKQDYPEDRRELRIFDDAGQYHNQNGPGWWLYSTPNRLHTHWQKYQRLASQARPGLIVIWEDDDVYLPHHLTEVARCFVETGKTWLVPDWYLTNVDCPKDGTLVKKEHKGGHHPAWAFTFERLLQARGYTTDRILQGDTELQNRLRDIGAPGRYGSKENPSFVYRWGIGAQNISGKGRDGFNERWNQLGKKPAPFIGDLNPHMDDETISILARLS